MFTNPTKPDPLSEEGSITEVDPIRKVCKVKTLSGQNLSGVPWSLPTGGASRGGDRVTPSLGDRVVISSKLGYPIIDSFLPKLQSEASAMPLQIDSGDTIIDTGNFSSSGKNVIGDPHAPRDMLAGDRIISSSGGGMLGLLRAGSILIRSSRFSEIFLSKLNDIVRISSRNFEHFTDVSTDVIRNIQGRIYRFVGYSKLIKDAKVEAYSFNQYIGDVALAEVQKSDYEAPDDLPEETDVVFKEQILDRTSPTPDELMYREIHLNGDQDIVIKNNDGTIFTRIKCTKDDINITYNDINVVHINKDEIAARKNGDPRSIVITDTSILSTFKDATVLMNDSGITSTYKDGVVKMDASAVTTTFQGSTHKVDANAVTSTHGSATSKVDSSGVHLTCGGHFLHVTSSGVAFG